MLDGRLRGDAGDLSFIRITLLIHGSLLALLGAWTLGVTLAQPGGLFTGGFLVVVPGFLGLVLLLAVAPRALQRTGWAFAGLATAIVLGIVQGVGDVGLTALGSNYGEALLYVVVWLAVVAPAALLAAFEADRRWSLIAAAGIVLWGLASSIAEGLPPANGGMLAGVLAGLGLLLPAAGVGGALTDGITVPPRGNLLAWRWGRGPVELSGWWLAGLVVLVLSWRLGGWFWGIPLWVVALALVVGPALLAWRRTPLRAALVSLLLAVGFVPLGRCVTWSATDVGGGRIPTGTDPAVLAFMGFHGPGNSAGYGLFGTQGGIHCPGVLETAAILWLGVLLAVTLWPGRGPVSTRPTSTATRDL